MKNTKLKELIDEMKPHKITSIEADFSGAGDSGEINDVRFYVAKGKKTEQVSFPQFYNQAMDIIHDTMVSKVSGDWWNNDGGYGSVVVDLKTGKASVEANYYEMRVSDTESVELDLEDLR